MQKRIKNFTQFPLTLSLPPSPSFSNSFKQVKSQCCLHIFDCYLFKRLLLLYFLYPSSATHNYLAIGYGYFLQSLVPYSSFSSLGLLPHDHVSDDIVVLLMIIVHIFLCLSMSCNLFPPLVQDPQSPLESSSTVADIIHAKDNIFHPPPPHHNHHNLHHGWYATSRPENSPRISYQMARLGIPHEVSIVSADRL